MRLIRNVPHGELEWTQVNDKAEHNEQPKDGHGRWSEVMDCFDRWLEADGPGRTALLAQLSAEDSSLLELVLRAIEADREAESQNFLRGNALSDITGTEEDAETTLDRKSVV